MSVEVRPFEGDPEELAAFVTRNWRIQYAKSGYAPTIVGDYFRWMIPSFAAGNSESIFAAYDGTTLVGTLPSDSFPATLKGKPGTMLTGDTLTVDAERLRSGIGKKLYAKHAEYARAVGSRFGTGFINSRMMTGKGRGFWTSASHQSMLRKQPAPWVRILSGSGASAGMQDRFEITAAWFAGLYGGPVRADYRAKEVRPYTAADLPACHRLFRRYMGQFDLAYQWDEARLAHHIDFPGLVTTLVYEQAGEISGFATCYAFEVMGRRPMHHSIIDMVAPQDQSIAARIKLLASAAAEVRSKGADLAIILGPPVNATSVLVASRFLPMVPTYNLFVDIYEPEPLLKEMHRPFAMFR